MLSSVFYINIVFKGYYYYKTKVMQISKLIIININKDLRGEASLYLTVNVIFVGSIPMEWIIFHFIYKREVCIYILHEAKTYFFIIPGSPSGTSDATYSSSRGKRSSLGAQSAPSARALPRIPTRRASHWTWATVASKPVAPRASQGEPQLLCKVT